MMVRFVRVQACRRVRVLRSIAYLLRGRRHLAFVGGKNTRHVVREEVRAVPLPQQHVRVAVDVHLCVRGQCIGRCASRHMLFFPPRSYRGGRNSGLTGDPHVLVRLGSAAVSDLIRRLSRVLCVFGVLCAGDRSCDAPVSAASTSSRCLWCRRCGGSWCAAHLRAPRCRRRGRAAPTPPARSLGGSFRTPTPA